MKFISLIITMFLLAACGEEKDGGTIIPTVSNNVTPTADFTFECTNKECAFTNSSTDIDGTITSFSWNFGDGNTSTEQNPVHIYKEYDQYEVQLQVTDNSGATSSISQTVVPPDLNLCGGSLPTESFVLTDVNDSNDLYSFLNDPQEPNFYNELAREHTYMRQVIENSELAASGSLVERYELRSGDCNGSDCERNPRFFRSEVSAGEENLRGWESWYAISFKLGEQFDIPESTSNGYDQRTTIMQFMNTNTERTAFRGNMFIGQYWRNGGGQLVLRDKNFDLQPDGSSKFVSWDRWVLAEKGTYEDNWNHMVINITFDADSPVKIWLNGKCVFDKKINVLGDTWDKVFFKWGLYRSESTEEEQGTVNNYVNSIYFDNIREGITYDDIAY